MSNQYKGTIQFFNPSNYHSRLPVHAMVVRGENHSALCLGNSGLPVSWFDRNGNMDKVTCNHCKIMIEESK